MTNGSLPISAESIKAKLKKEAASCAKDYNFLFYGEAYTV